MRHESTLDPADARRDSDLAQYSSTPSLGVAQVEDEADDEDENEGEKGRQAPIFSTTPRTSPQRDATPLQPSSFHLLITPLPPFCTAHHTSLLCAHQNP